MLAHRSLTNLALLIIKNVINLSSQYADVRMHWKRKLIVVFIIGDQPEEFQNGRNSKMSNGLNSKMVNEKKFQYAKKARFR